MHAPAVMRLHTLYSEKKVLRPRYIVSSVPIHEWQSFDTARRRLNAVIRLPAAFQTPRW